MSDSELIPRDLEFEDFIFKRFGRQRLSSSQFGLMVDFMSLNPELIHRKITATFTKEDWHKKWEELASLLNADFTGARKDARKWRRSWQDQKFIIKTKAAKLASGSSGSVKSSYKLTDLEERVLKLVNAYSPHVCKEEAVNHSIVKNLNIQQTSNDVKCVPKEIGPTSCLIISLDTANGPVRLEPSNFSFSKLDPVNNLLAGLESRNVTPIRLESASNLPVRLETINSVSVNSASVSDLEQNVGDIPLRLETTADSLEIETEKVQESREKEQNSSLMIKLKPLVAVPKTVSEEVRKCHEGIAKTNALKRKIRPNSTIFQRKHVLKSRLRMRRMWKPRKTPTALSQCMPTNNSFTEKLLNKAKSRIPEGPEISPSSEDVQELIITEGNFKDSSSQNSSSNPPKKKLKFSNHSCYQRKNDFGMVKLLQRQNELLEGIAGSLTRIEKSLNDRCPREVQRKNNMLVNISENIEKLAESLGAVSKSLKSVVEE